MLGKKMGLLRSRRLPRKGKARCENIFASISSHSDKESMVLFPFITTMVPFEPICNEE